MKNPNLTESEFTAHLGLGAYFLIAISLSG